MQGHPSSRGAWADSAESTDEMCSRVVSIQVHVRGPSHPTTGSPSLVAGGGPRCSCMALPLLLPLSASHLDLEPLPPSGGILGSENCRLFPPFPADALGVLHCGPPGPWFISYSGAVLDPHFSLRLTVSGTPAYGAGWVSCSLEPPRRVSSRSVPGTPQSSVCQLPSPGLLRKERC